MIGIAHYLNISESISASDSGAFDSTAEATTTVITNLNASIYAPSANSYIIASLFCNSSSSDAGFIKLTCTGGPADLHLDLRLWLYADTAAGFGTETQVGAVSHVARGNALTDMVHATPCSSVSYRYAPGAAGTYYFRLKGNQGISGGGLTRHWLLTSVRLRLQCFTPTPY